MKCRRTAGVVLLGVALHACDNSTGPLVMADPCDVLGFAGAPNIAFSAAGVMQASPVIVGAIASIIPLGNLNPPNHVYPTGHMYIVLSNSAAGANNLPAPASGRVIKLYQPGGTDWKLVVRVDTSFVYFLDHITPFPSITVGAQVTAGQGVGQNSGLAAAVDFGVYNFNNPPLTGILNDCVAKGSRYVDSPLKYYSGSTQQSLYAKVATTGNATKDGRFDYDESGKLVGNWVLTGQSPLTAPDKTLSFAYNVLNHAPRVSIGSSLGGGGAFAVQAGAPDFAAVSQATGQVNYRLFSTGSGDSSAPGAEFGLLAVQVLSATRIKVELFPGNLTGAATFTAAALTYDR